MAGCADNSLTRLLDDRGSQPQVQAQAYQDLTMPPDLTLPPPGSAPPPPAPSAATAPPSAPKLASAPASPSGAAAPQPEGDVFERNGISKFHPDGTPKTKTELQNELKQVYLAKKRQANPNYGTIFNIGEIFSDG